jgi:glutamyl-tRNA reductase
MMSSISIIGSGNMASTIGALAIAGGHTVEVIGRDAAKSAALAKSLGGGATAGTFGAAPTGDIVILAGARDTGDLRMAHWVEGAGVLTMGLARNGVGNFDFSLGINNLTMSP